MERESVDKARVSIVKAMSELDVDAFDKTDLILYLISALDNMTREENKVKCLKKKVSDRNE